MPPIAAGSPSTIQLVVGFGFDLRQPLAARLRIVAGTARA